MTQLVPNVTFAFREGDEAPEGGGCPIGGEFVFKTSTDLFANKQVVIFSLPGAFTPTCSAKHVPGYVENFDAFKAAGVDEIWCLSVNDAFVMGAWARDQKTSGKVRMLATRGFTFCPSSMPPPPGFAP